MNMASVPVVPMTREEINELARRLEARAESVVMRDQQQQQSDLRSAARLLREHVLK